jgi:hypothetical protein
MQRTTRRAAAWIATLVAACLGLAIGPQAAVAKSQEYVGDFDVPQTGFGGEPSTIEMKVKLEKKDGKLVPTVLKSFRWRILYYHCPDGTVSHDSTGVSGMQLTDYDGTPVDVKRRKFRDHTEFTDEGGGPVERSYDITGVIPKNGPATGTLQVGFRDTFPEQFCMSDVVGWHASPVG